MIGTRHLSSVAHEMNFQNQPSPQGFEQTIVLSIRISRFGGFPVEH